MPDFLEGELLLIDKPLNWTSFDVVNKVRFSLKKLLQVKKIKVGHAGTLDPLATGLLILCTGKKTKQIDQIQAQEKEYTGKICLGATTASFDQETEPENQREIDHLKEADLLKIRDSFLGKIQQVPPIFSAKRVQGKKAYELARKGKNPEMKSREVYISTFEIEKIEWPSVSFRIACSKGTYIRSIAHDFGQALGVGAYLAELRRTKIGDYSLKNALSIEEFVAQIQDLEQAN